jgi:hypothetical protein
MMVFVSVEITSDLNAAAECSVLTCFASSSASISAAILGLAFNLLASLPTCLGFAFVL